MTGLPQDSAAGLTSANPGPGEVPLPPNGERTGNSGPCVCATLRTSLSCDLSSVSAARLELRGFLQQHGVRREEVSACELALAEACNNAIQNATTDGRRRSVEVLAICTRSKVELHVNDHTLGFDWPSSAVELPDIQDEHGRGLFFIQSVMDSATYFRRRDGNGLIMRKMRAQAQSDNSAPQTGVASEAERSAQLAEMQQVLGEMVRELCFRSETLAAICRCSADLGRSNDLKEFSERLLNDLLHIAVAEWFLVRTIDERGHFSIFVASTDTASVRDIVFGPGKLSYAEAESARTRADVEFGPNQPLAPEDPLAILFPGVTGLVHPIRVDQTLIGTLAIGRGPLDSPFSVAQREVIRTFADFLASQMLNGKLREEQISNRLIGHELEIARSIQRSLLPKTLPKLRGFGLAAHCQSARQVGGDFYDLLQVSDTSVLLVIADVMGKGVPAALFAAQLRSLVRANPESSTRPAQLLTRINQLLFDDLSRVSMFITAQIVLLDVAQRRAVVGSAGHCPLLVGQRGGATVQAVTSDGLPLGVMHNTTFEESSLMLPAGARLLLYTDGVTESRNRSGECFGEHRLQEWLRSNGNSLRSTDSLKANLISTLNEFESSSLQGEGAPHGKRPLSNGQKERQRGRIAMKAKAALKLASDSLYDDRTFLIAAEEETAADRPDRSGSRNKL